MASAQTMPPWIGSSASEDPLGRHGRQPASWSWNGNGSDPCLWMDNIPDTYSSHSSKPNTLPTTDMETRTNRIRNVTAARRHHTPSGSGGSVAALSWRTPGTSSPWVARTHSSERDYAPIPYFPILNTDVASEAGDSQAGAFPSRRGSPGNSSHLLTPLADAHNTYRGYGRPASPHLSVADGSDRLTPGSFLTPSNMSSVASHPSRSSPSDYAPIPSFLGPMQSMPSIPETLSRPSDDDQDEAVGEELSPLPPSGNELPGRQLPDRTEGESVSERATPDAAPLPTLSAATPIPVEGTRSPNRGRRGIPWLSAFRNPFNRNPFRRRSHLPTLAEHHPEPTTSIIFEQGEEEDQRPSSSSTRGDPLSPSSVVRSAPCPPPPEAISPLRNQTETTPIPSAPLRRQHTFAQFISPRTGWRPHAARLRLNPRIADYRGDEYHVSRARGVEAMSTTAGLQRGSSGSTVDCPGRFVSANL
ncbi:unnamed protein product [Vitrella brassicaformis CCMP3155]|uniref:Uncharacterized protein n=1 Tax=Vitrella brassicaformis (strain CCMP3155) TaxID=1169540 RepID=A0A0G4H2B9_VITBC|nr:unnamed protein product [Vitrella brassicaformis CCMP3155]|mmetsp:Transcript_9921/g.28622  ORF Transcript_9921/g.28622 Transcript_9921/m.28622 type:complete len:473 (-) Transcript_9921:1028-2446(-)|eukprot:CEM37686.1 unnamed protein product [Vitrella brassicaformis CCMP3155]